MTSNSFWLKYRLHEWQRKAETIAREAIQ